MKGIARDLDPCKDSACRGEFNPLLITFSHFSLLNVVWIVGKCVLLPSQTRHVLANERGT